MLYADGLLLDLSVGDRTIGRLEGAGGTTRLQPFCALAWPGLLLLCCYYAALHCIGIAMPLLPIALRHCLCKVQFEVTVTDYKLSLQSDYNVVTLVTSSDSSHSL